MRKFVKVIDYISDNTGKQASWLAAVLVLLISLEIIMREVFNKPTYWNFETSLMVGGTMMSAGWAYAMRHRAHIRVDVFYSRLSQKGKAMIDILGTFVFFFPLVSIFCMASFVRMRDAWVRHQVSYMTYWYPPIAPFRTVIFVAFLLLGIQGLANFISDLRVLLRDKPYD